MLKFIIIPIFSLSLLISCTKIDEGPGGTSSIVGKVYVKNYDQTFTTLNGEYYAADKDVFIIYGDEVTFGDRVRTNYDGTFAFMSLRKGAYTIYTYSKDSTMQSASGIIPILAEVEIKGNKEVVEVEDMLVFE